MSNDDDGVYQSASGRRRRLHRTQIAVGVTGLAALLGAASYVITAGIVDRRDHSVTGDIGALAPLVTPSPAPWTPVPVPRSAQPTISTKDAVRRAASPTPSPSLASLASLGALAESAEVQERSEATPTGTLRVVTARFDLTGKRELRWAADRGKPAGAARCTRNLRFSKDPRPAVRPHVLLCWQTSPTRSVVTVVVNHDGTPSVARSVEVIDREWAKLG